jgi:hypothetical protein
MSKKTKDLPQPNPAPFSNYSDGVPDTTTHLPYIPESTRTLPDEITPEIAEVLAFDAQDAAKIAERFRDAGHPVGEGFEAEHSFVLFWLLGFALKHGPDWKTYAAAELPPAKKR